MVYIYIYMYVIYYINRRKMNSLLKILIIIVWETFKKMFFHFRKNLYLISKFKQI